MLRVLVVTLLLITAALLETALFPFVTLAGFRPNLLLLIVVGMALSDGAMPGVRTGFGAGLLADLMVHQSPVGLGALVLTGVGFTVGMARPYLAPDSLAAPMLLAFVSGLLGTAGYGVLALLLGDDRVTLSLLAQASVSVALYNTLLAPIVFGVVKRLTHRFSIESSPVML